MVVVAVVAWCSVLDNIDGLLGLPETGNCGSRGGRGGGGEVPGAAGDGLVAATALPDGDGRALHGVLAAENASVPGVCRGLELARELTQGGAIAHAVTAGDANLQAQRRYGWSWSSLREEDIL